jgi:ABC-type sugar transport system ATPase subunit
VADRVTVLRDGRYVTTLDTAGTTEPELVRLMVGRDLGTPVARTSQAGQEPVLEVRGLTLEGVLDSISFGLCRGEILGVAGLMGAGRTELAEVLYGLVAPDAGHMVLDGVAYRPDGPRAAIAAGMGFLTEDRKAAGIFPDLSVAHNLSMALIPELTRAWGTMLDRQAERACVNRFRESMDIRCTSDAQTVRFLSGGNQQKVLLARALATQCRLLVLCEPTRGVDVGAKSEIHRLIRALADQGVAVVLVSSDLPEIIALSDRALVMHEGRVTADLEREQLTEERIMAHATGQESRV